MALDTQKPGAGSVGQHHHTALLIIDMINTLEFPQGERLLRQALPAARAISRLKRRLKSQGVPVLYVNDNFGRWRSDWRHIYQTCADQRRRGAALAATLEPEADDYFVLKPKHSGFYCTSLEMLLTGFRTRRLIITGIAGNICVLFTANDAHMRELEVWVPEDCVASNSRRENEWALRQMRDTLGVDTRLSRAIRL